MFVLRREGKNRHGDKAVGTYFRLVREPDAKTKRLGFERALARLQSGEGDPAVFRYRQGDLRAIPGVPWVYWITPGIRHLFATFPKLAEDTGVRIGMRTGDNFRFLRFWWEVGLFRIALGCRNAEDAQATVKSWFPYMKGGSFKRWWGNQEYVLEWGNNGQIIKENTKHNYPQLGDNLGWKISNESFYFRRGITFPNITSGTFSARLSPGGFVFDVSGSSLFPTDVHLILAVMNSTFAAYLDKFLRGVLPDAPAAEWWEPTPEDAELGNLRGHAWAAVIEATLTASSTEIEANDDRGQCEIDPRR